MGPRVRKTTSGHPARRSSDIPQPGPRPEPGPGRGKDPRPRRLNDVLYTTLQELSERLADIQSCSCPFDCRAPDAVNTPLVSSPGGPQTPQRPARCTRVERRSNARENAVVTAEAYGTTEVQFPRGENAETCTLRMSLQVHNDPYSTTRKGVSNAFNFLTLVSVLIRWPFAFRVRAWVIGFLTTVRATAPIISCFFSTNRIMIKLT